MTASRRAASILTAAVYAILAALPHPEGYQPAPPRFEFTEVHMGLPVRIVLHAGGEEEARRAARAAFARIRALDGVMSDYRPDSEVRRLEATAGVFAPASDDLFRVLELAIAIAERTGGAFDPTVGPLAVLWRDARRSARLPDPAALASARARTGWRLLELDRARRHVRLRQPGMRLDLGGIAKGYILQAARDTMRSHGAGAVLLESGGDIVAGEAPPGSPGWRVETPGADEAFSRRAAALSNAALATSGPTAQFVEIEGRRYSHVIDPRTGMALTTAASARVIAPDAALADALATALTVDPSARRRLQTIYPEAVLTVGK